MSEGHIWNTPEALRYWRRFFGELLLRCVAIADGPAASAFGIPDDYMQSRSITAGDVNLLLNVLRATLENMDYAVYLQTDWWRGVRRRALRRARGRCQLCNSGKALQVHHRTYERRGCERPQDVVVLCRACHATYHGKPQ